MEPAICTHFAGGPYVPSFKRAASTIKSKHCKRLIFFFYVIIFFAKLKRLLDAANIPLLAKQSNSLSNIMLDYKMGYIPLPHLLKCQNEEQFFNR